VKETMLNPVVGHKEALAEFSSASPPHLLSSYVASFRSLILFSCLSVSLCLSLTNRAWLHNAIVLPKGSMGDL
jgi:hypothetical protein